MSRIDDLKADVAELQQLEAQAQRPQVKDVLGMHIRKLQTTISSLEETSAAGVSAEKPIAVVTAAVRRPHKEITNYGWDQSEKFMKIYVTINGIQNHSKDSIKCSFTKRSFKMQVENFEGKDHTLHVTNLHADLILEDCFHKVKTDMVLLMLKKQNAGETWPYVIKKAEEKKEAKKPVAAAPAGEGEAGDGLMNMLKKMYDEGDDQMKQTLAKAWTESRNKSPDAMASDMTSPGMMSPDMMSPDMMGGLGAMMGGSMGGL